MPRRRLTPGVSTRGYLHPIPSPSARRWIQMSRKPSAERTPLFPLVGGSVAPQVSSLPWGGPIPILSGGADSISRARHAMSRPHSHWRSSQPPPTTPLAKPRRGGRLLISAEFGRIMACSYGVSFPVGGMQAGTPLSPASSVTSRERGSCVWMLQGRVEESRRGNERALSRAYCPKYVRLCMGMDVCRRLEPWSRVQTRTHTQTAGTPSPSPPSPPSLPGSTFHFSPPLAWSPLFFFLFWVCLFLSSFLLQF